MIEHEVKHMTTILSSVYDFAKIITEFCIVFLRMVLLTVQAIIKCCFPKKLKNIEGEIVLITGAGHGIGRALALEYVKQYSNVVCVDINTKENNTTVMIARRLHQGYAFGYTCDIRDREAVLELADKVRKEVGPVSILINNAGIMPINPLEKQMADDIQRTFDINVFAHFWTLQAFLPQMKEQMHGHVVAISSISGLIGLPNLMPYSATKFAVRGLMESLYNELRNGPYNNLIKTTTICPYMTNTGLCKNAKIRFPRFLGLLDTEEVAKKIVHAQRSSAIEITVPVYWHIINKYCRLLPLQSAVLLMDFVGSGVQPE